MEVRTATRDDIEPIRAVARASMDASYGHALPPSEIAEAVSRWHGTERVGTDIDREDAVILVATDGGEVIAFVQAYLDTQRPAVADIDWLHVAPERREEGIGTELLAAAERTLRERGIALVEGHVMVENEVGVRFYERHGFERAGETAVDVGSESFTERRYVKRLDEDAPSAESLVARPGPEGDLHVDFTRRERGSLGPFYPAYADADADDRYGWFCSNCDGFDTAMDTMGRIECTDCGNRRKPSRWDAAYL